MKSHYELALKIKIREFRDERFLLADTINNIGNVYSAQKDPSHVLEYYARALNLNEQKFGENDIDLIPYRNNLQCRQQMCR